MIQIDMPMPDNCDECRFNTEYGFCKAMPDNFCGNTDNRKRPEWCPLKEQEAVEPIKGEDMDSSSACWWYVCPSCKIAIDYQDRFCRHCGKAMKWSDENDCQKNIER